MSYQSTATRETSYKGDTNLKSPQALPFEFGLRRRAINYLVKRQANDELDPAVGNYSTD